MKVSETGMWYQVVEKNSEQNAQPGQVAHLWYVMELLDGTVAHSSANEGDLKFRISQGGVESGLEEAILMLGKGDKARFILPPHLAHGLTGDLDKIPPRASIVYSIKVLDITSN
jgi:FKBP-type peptidyl-prolyl cis-trans isomerase